MTFKKVLTGLLLIILICVFLSPAARTLSDNTPDLSEAGQTGEYWLAGTSESDITPRAEHLNEELFMGGYGVGKERGPAEGIREKVRARSLALSDERTTVVFIILDSPGISCSDLTAIRSSVSEETGIIPQNIMITVTHTHSGPDLQGLWGGVPSSYREWVHSQASESATEALGSMQPVQLFYGSADYSEGITNRRGEDYLASAFHLLHARSLTDEPVATLAVYGVHTTFLGEDNMMISPDFSGKLVNNLENELGGTALFAPGIQGDQIPYKGDLDIQEYARDLTGIALDAYERAEVIPVSYLRYNQAEFALGVRNPVFFLAYLLRYLSHYEVNFNLRNGLHINTEVSYLALGDKLALATVPGEILAKPGHEIMRMSPVSDTVVIGLTNGTLGYLVHENQWNGGIPFLNRGYEESVSMGKHVWPIMRTAFRRIME